MEENVNNSGPAPVSSGNNLGSKIGFQINKINIVLLAVALFFLVGGVLFLVSRITKNNPSTSKISKNTDYAHTSLLISEDVRQASAGKYEVDVNIDSLDNNVTGVQLELSFDPKQLQNVDIVSGDFFTNPTVIQKKVDQGNGKITYVLSTPIGGDGPQGKGTVAVISFTKVGEAETMIRFLPQTLVSAQGQDKSVLRETVNASIGTLPGSSASPNLTPQ